MKKFFEDCLECIPAQNLTQLLEKARDDFDLLKSVWTWHANDGKDKEHMFTRNGSSRSMVDIELSSQLGLPETATVNVSFIGSLCHEQVKRLTP